MNAHTPDQPLPVFRTRRLLVRPVQNTEADRRHYRDVFGCADAMRFVTGEPESEARARERHERYWRSWAEGGRLRVFAVEPNAAIATKTGGVLEPGAPVGDVMIVPLPKDGDDYELGYRFATRAWGLGLATEAARAVLPYAFESMALRHLLAVTYPDNKPSQRVLTKLGFARVGLTRAYYNGKELALFRLDRAAWAAQRGSMGSMASSKPAEPGVGSPG